MLSRWLAAGPGFAVREWRGDSPGRVWPADELAYEAASGAAGLAGLGVGPGDRVILALPNDASFVAALLACAHRGAIAVPAPVSDRRGADERIAGIVADCGPRVVVDPALWAGLRATSSTVDEQPAGDVALLQYTSGSTGDPKGVVVTYGMLAASCAQAASAYRESTLDTAVTWVPLHHDMGLVTGVLRPLYSGYPTVLLDPADFVAAPRRWLAALSVHRGTLSSAPNFAYDLCVRKADPAGLDLSSWRVARNAGEPVLARTLARFAARFAVAGFRPEALCPSYGLAEATLTVTTTTPSDPPRSLDGYVSSGAPVPGTDVRGVDGRIEIRGPQVSPGYWGRPARESEWYATGDLGFLTDGHLYVQGRADDTLVIHGRNVYQGDVRAACAEVPGTRPGRCAAVWTDDDPPRVRLLVETTSTVDPKQIQRHLAHRLGIYVSTVDLLAPGELPLTTSGKVRVRAAAALAPRSRPSPVPR